MTYSPVIHKGTAPAALKVPGDTLPEIFLKQAALYGSSRVALRYRTNTHWQEYNWRDYFDHVQKTAAALAKLGVQRDDKICILSSNCPEWVFIYLAVQSLAACLVPIYPNNTPEQVQYIVEHSEAKFLFVENGEQLIKTEGWRSAAHNLQKIIQIFDAAPDGIMAYQDLMVLGMQGDDNFLKKQIEKLTANTLAGIIYTSGTTGPPKGVRITQKNLIFMARSLFTRFQGAYEEETISFLPLSHIAEQLLTICVGIVIANTVSFARSIETIKADLVDVRPTLFFSVPRLYEKVYATILETVATASFFKRRLFNWALSVGDKIRKNRNGGPVASAFTRFQWEIAGRLVFGKLRKKAGLDRAHILASGAAPLPAEVSRFFGSMGMDIYEVFGQTECTGVCTTTVPGKTVPGAIGPPVPGCEVALADDGEIMIRGDNLFSGYWKDPAATDEALREGWLYTGDIGFFDENNYLHITDRKKDIIVTAGGKNIAPQNIETQLKLNQGVSQVVVVGDKRRYLTCLFTLNRETLPKLCAHLGLENLSLEEAVNNNKIIRQFQGYVEKVNAALARFETIKYFRILPHDFSIEGGELTPTLKVKRRVINEKYKSIIDLMYV
jgi:long-chain acyl-CoA synthetase